MKTSSPTSEEKNIGRWAWPTRVRGMICTCTPKHQHKRAEETWINRSGNTKNVNEQRTYNKQPKWSPSGTSACLWRKFLGNLVPQSLINCWCGGSVRTGWLGTNKGLDLRPEMHSHSHIVTIVISCIISCKWGVLGTVLYACLGSPVLFPSSRFQ